MIHSRCFGVSLVEAMLQFRYALVYMMLEGQPATFVMASTCQGRSFSLLELATVLEDAKRLWDFLSSHGLVHKTYKCPSCDTDLPVNNSFRFRCSKVVKRRTEKKSVVRRCSVNVSAAFLSVSPGSGSSIPTYYTVR